MGDPLAQCKFNGNNHPDIDWRTVVFSGSKGSLLDSVQSIAVKDAICGPTDGSTTYRSGGVNQYLHIHAPFST